MRLQYRNIFVKENRGKFIVINAFIVEEEKIKTHNKHLTQKGRTAKHTPKY